MVKSGLEFILKFTEPLQRYLLNCQANAIFSDPVEKSLSDRLQYNWQLFKSGNRMRQNNITNLEVAVLDDNW